MNRHGTRILGSSGLVFPLACKSLGYLVSWRQAWVFDTESTEPATPGRSSHYSRPPQYTPSFPTAPKSFIAHESPFARFDQIDLFSARFTYRDLLLWIFFPPPELLRPSFLYLPSCPQWLDSPQKVALPTSSLQGHPHLLPMTSSISLLQIFLSLCMSNVFLGSGFIVLPPITRRQILGR